jgi:hypothetical protein
LDLTWILAAVGILIAVLLLKKLVGFLILILFAFFIYQAFSGEKFSWNSSFHQITQSVKDFPEKIFDYTEDIAGDTNKSIDSKISNSFNKNYNKLGENNSQNKKQSSGKRSAADGIDINSYIQKFKEAIRKFKISAESNIKKFTK